MLIFPGMITISVLETRLNVLNPQRRFLLRLVVQVRQRAERCESQTKGTSEEDKTAYFSSSRQKRNNPRIILQRPAFVTSTSITATSVTTTTAPFSWSFPTIYIYILST
ncbi:hypothetical protein E2C01_035895 [Portunus trituberculatus]|uniref:Uncharacterized protein n=1 Tax=Portunus trituberculatus TaxID=210409 RepID=A0A5B7FAE2_PORTR|nr:hypothetical protein [Portunus trituberculatus]